MLLHILHIIIFFTSCKTIEKWHIAFTIRLILFHCVFPPVIKMLKFGVLVLLPFVLGGAPHGSGYALNRANNQGNRPGPAINMGSSGNNRMSITNFGPLPNKPNNILNPVNRQMRPTSRYSSDVPYRKIICLCTSSLQNKILRTF